MNRITSLGMVAALFAQPVAANPIEEYKIYQKTVKATADLVMDQKSRSIVSEFGLDLLNVTWEDTGRTKNSSWGPNISDMTIQVHTVSDDGKIAPVAMPVVRYNNFHDKTADLSPNDFKLLVGNEKGKEDLEVVTLTEYLDNFRKYLSDEKSWAGRGESLLAPRDTHVLVSAQHTFLPVPEGQKAHFNPVLFNYQSSEKNPAVLAIVATREGTSATIIDNKRDAFEGGRSVWGQRLFHNTNGERASFTGERLTDFVINEGGIEKALSGVTANSLSGANMVLLIQVPLVHKARNIGWGCGGMFCLSMADSSILENSRSFEDAVIGHGPVEGPFTEIDGLEIKRDTRFPIRVTVQFYKATDGSEFTTTMAEEMRNQINAVYKNADYVGSLVTEGRTGRPTEHQGPIVRWNPIGFPWWHIYWGTLEAQGGMTETQGLQMLRDAYGDQWVRHARTEEKLKETLEFLSSLDDASNEQ